MEMSTNLVGSLIIAGASVIGLVVIGIILSKLYTRASKEVSFVRTGFGGQKVIMNGGALVFPVLHEVIPVNMNTLRLAVNRANDQALITRDRMRVDVLAEFYVRVQPTAESIANAAQTLGIRTMEPASLKELVEGKFVDALRAVAAEMAMTELHEQRVSFVQKVQQVVSEDLLKNGLELESVSLTGLDQTSREHFNPDNAFDAEGLTKLTQEIEARRKRRNEIEQETQVEIERKNLEAEQQRLEITREQEYARLEQQREVEIRRAEQTSEIARQQAERKQEAEQAEIAALLDVGYFMDRASTVYGYDHFLVDAGGSLIEVVDLDNPADDPVLQHLTRRTQLVYIEAPDAHVERLIERTIAYPKPMFYRAAFLDAAIAEYSAETGIASANDFAPLEFVKWVFPRLINARRERYERLVEAGLARRVAADDIARVETEADFLDLVG